MLRDRLLQNSRSSCCDGGDASEIESAALLLWICEAFFSCENLMENSCRERLLYGKCACTSIVDASTLFEYYFISHAVFVFPSLHVISIGIFQTYSLGTTYCEYIICYTYVVRTALDTHTRIGIFTLLKNMSVYTILHLLTCILRYTKEK